MEVLLIVPVILLFLFVVIVGVDRKPATTHLSVPEKKEPVEKETLKNVSEPVISFVKFLKENPENFLMKLESCIALRFREYDYKFKLIDKANRKVYKYTIVSDSKHYPNYLEFSTDSVGFLTYEENKYLLEAHLWGVEYIRDKKKEEYDAKVAIEREEYKKIYCKGGR